MKKIKIYIAFVLLCILAVSGLCEEVQAASKIRLNYSSISLYEKKTKTLKAKVSPKSKKVKWSSSNKKVATVSSKGKVTGKKKGTAYITATISGTKIKARCKVTVKKKVSLKEQYKQYIIGNWYSESGGKLEITATYFGSDRYKVTKAEKSDNDICVYLTLTDIREKYLLVFENGSKDNFRQYRYNSYNGSYTGGGEEYTRSESDIVLNKYKTFLKKNRTKYPYYAFVNLSNCPVPILLTSKKVEKLYVPRLGKYVAHMSRGAEIYLYKNKQVKKVETLKEYFGLFLGWDYVVNDGKSGLSVYRYKAQDIYEAVCYTRARYPDPPTRYTYNGEKFIKEELTQEELDREWDSYVNAAVPILFAKNSF